MNRTKPDNWTTASQQQVYGERPREEQSAGLVLVYSRLHASLPSVVVVRNGPATIGREDGNSLRIPEAAVSRNHARVEQRGATWWVVDQGSTNGVIVNGARVAEAPLAPHDLVRIGDTIFRFAASQGSLYAPYAPDGRVQPQQRPFAHDRSGCPLVGGYQIDALLDRLHKVAAAELSVIAHGESGTGKELVAREVHRRSGRRGAFQAINCAALSPTLIESELFGHRRGAFTGATHDQPGLVRAADGGTLFLDEIGDMPLEAQAKLLRVIQEKEVVPIGATRPIPVDVRIVSATHRDLESLVSQSAFRGDLLARLRDVVVTLPPLRQRREDLLALIRHFLAELGAPTRSMSFSFMLAVAHYHWPYNVRELDSAVRLALALAGDETLDVRHLPPAVQAAVESHGKPAPAPTAPRAHESLSHGARAGQPPSESELRHMLATHGGNVAAVGRAYGKERMQVHRWMKRYGIDVAQYRQ